MTSSALGQAVLLGLEIESVERHVLHLRELLAELRRSRRRWEAGDRGEQGVVRALVGMDDSGWHVLADRRWPGTRSANIDVLVVGAGGVFVVDVKNWRDVRVENGRLWRGEADAEDDVRKLEDQCTAVERILSEEGLPPSEVVPLLVLAGRRNAQARIGRIEVLGELDLTADLVRRGVRLPPDVVERLVTVLDRECSPMPVASSRSGSAPAPAPAAPAPAAPAPAADDDGLLSKEEVWQAVVEAAAREPIESWMTWLHPAQTRLVNRRWSGPARVRGAAGTGKTVVALHRAKYLAARGDTVLFTSFVRTLSPVHRALFARLAPEHTGSVHFSSVHAVAARCLREHGVRERFDPSVAQTCFARAWSTVGSRSALADLGVGQGYWRTEIATVIKGQGLDDFAQYADRPRIGRRIPLQAVHRRAVWDLLRRYQELLNDRGVLDADDLLLQARDLVRRGGGAGPAFDAVVVDEVQDLTCVGLQFLHAFVGDRPDGLLVVGDGQQSVYAGGFTLADAGISVVGRSTVLQRNYRNRELILRYALAVVADDEFDDLDTDPQVGVRNVDIERPGGQVIQVEGDKTSQGMALCAHLREVNADDGVRFGDMAVLAPTNQQVGDWQRVLRAAGIPTMLATEYQGSSVDAVKLGTFHRTKGLEFAWVFIPDRDRFPAPTLATESADAYRERAELERRQLFVALTRARDGLWMGTRGEAATL